MCGHFLVAVCCVALLRMFSKRSEADRSGIWNNYAPMLMCFLASSTLAIPSWILLILAYRNFYRVPLDNVPLSQSPHFKAAFPFYSAYLAIYPFHFALQCTGKLLVLLRFCEQILRPQSAAATRAVIQLGSRYGFIFFVVLNFCSIVSACVTAGRSVQWYRVMPLPPPPSAADSQEFASIGNALLDSLGFNFVFEAAVLLLIVLLFLVGGVMALRFFRQVSDSLDHVALHVGGGSAARGSAAKAKVLREGVDSMGRLLVRTTVVVFVTFVVQASYNLMYAAASYAEVFRPDCSSLCDALCHDSSAILGHAIRLTPALTASVNMLSTLLGSAVSIFGMTYGSTWYKLRHARTNLNAAAAAGSPLELVSAGGGAAAHGNA